MYAPNGYDDVAALIVRPNPGANFSAANYEAKAERWKALWPEITVLPAEAESVGWAKRSEPTSYLHRWSENVVRHGASAPLPTLRAPRNGGIGGVCRNYRTTPEVNPAFRRGGLMSFFRKQCASLPA